MHSTLCHIEKSFKDDLFENMPFSRRKDVKRKLRMKPVGNIYEGSWIDLVDPVKVPVYRDQQICPGPNALPVAGFSCLLQAEVSFPRPVIACSAEAVRRAFPVILFAPRIGSWRTKEKRLVPFKAQTQK